MNVTEISKESWTDTRGERLYSERFIVVTDAYVIGAGDTVEQALFDAKRECFLAGIPEPETVEIWDQGE